MTILEQDNQLACDSDTAWQVLADFGNFLAWATGGVGSATLEGEGPGMIRHLDIPGLGPVSERLDVLDPASRTLSYTLVSQGMGGMARYSATVQVISDGHEPCRLRWRGEFEPQPGTDCNEVRNFLADSYSTMTQGLEAYVNTRT